MDIETLSQTIDRSQDKTKVIISNPPPQLDSKGFGDSGLQYIILHCRDLVDLCISTTLFNQVRNNISRQGVQRLTEAPWRNLQFIDLCTFCVKR